MKESGRPEHYNAATLREEMREIARGLARCRTLERARHSLYDRVSRMQVDATRGGGDLRTAHTRDAARAMRSMLSERSEKAAGFSVTRALWEVARGKPGESLSEAFHAEMIHLMRAMHGLARIDLMVTQREWSTKRGREGAIAWSAHLDELWQRVQATMDRYQDGLSPEAVERRAQRRERILEALGGKPADWNKWTWHVRNIIRDPEVLARVLNTRRGEMVSLRAARRARLPFGITPYYASLMDDDSIAGRDRAIRAQVLPPADYVAAMSAHREDRTSSFDFMREADTSPVDLVTRRYPAIVILKPYNSCPQICVYCQRNWEIEDAMAPSALAPFPKIEKAIAWIGSRPAVREVLITGGDPFALSDGMLRRILDLLAGIDHVDVIRIGTRTPVTLPSRITHTLAKMLGKYREPGRREIMVMTHVEHPYEVTPETVWAVDRLKRRGIGVYNQLVYTFYISRRFEAAALRVLLRKCGIDPYYTFVTKGKEETGSYRVPIARLLQEQKEETRLMPGSRRTDEAVYNLPGTGKNYMRAIQHRDLISVMPDGSRVYVFHPWEKNVVASETYVGTDVPILDYLRRLETIGEDPADYGSIWYYY